MVANKENKQQQQLAQVILQLETRRRLTSAKGAKPATSTEVSWAMKAATTE
jgi:hypothetical protein